MGPRSRIRDSLARSLTLLRVFVYASGAILLAGAVVLGSMLTRAIWDQAVRHNRADVAEYVQTVLAPRVVRDDRIVVDQSIRGTLERVVRMRHDVLSVKLWSRDGRLLWTNLAQERIGRRFPLDDGLAHVLATGEPAGHVERLDKSESRAESRLADQALEVYAPVLSRAGSPIGAYEVYVDTAEVESVVADGVLTIWLSVGAVFVLLYLVLVGLVRGASHRLRQQTATLRSQSAALTASYQQLEESSLGAIESLNAVVEAKDPYTAGHSQRVRRIAVAIGRELGLPADRLDALATSALFHDIGKIAVPDAVLTKPGPLDAAEFGLVKEHAAKGSEIVSKLPRLAGCVSAIRHHHERWDGRGYPDGLAGDEIPLDAAVVGLADAWDAMTTDRPYARALALAEAFEQVRAGRGSQFHPDVVDAFLAVARRAHGALGSAAPHALAG